MGLFDRGQDPRDVIIADLREQLSRAHEREMALLKLVSDGMDKLSAHADVKAHMAATRAPAPLRQEPDKTRSITPPPGIAGLNRTGAVHMKDVRLRQEARRIGVLRPVQVRD